MNTEKIEEIKTLLALLSVEGKHIYSISCQSGSEVKEGKYTVEVSKELLLSLSKNNKKNLTFQGSYFILNFNKNLTYKFNISDKKLKTPINFHTQMKNLEHCEKDDFKYIKMIDKTLYIAVNNEEIPIYFDKEKDLWRIEYPDKIEMDYQKDVYGKNGEFGHICYLNYSVHKKIPSDWYTELENFKERE